jgi:hypothetical protein
MLGTTAQPRRCYGGAMALGLLRGRGHIGAGSLEGVCAAVDDLARSDEEPRAGRGRAELVDVKVRDVAAALHGLGEPA